MSKIICEICGTSYADSANQCPICGTARPAQIANAVDSSENAQYTYVKGGRFSKRNVRVRNGSNPDYVQEKPSGAKIGLIAVLVVLILAVIAIAVYVGITLTAAGNDTPTEPAPSQSISNPCQAIILPQKEILLENVGDTFALNARKSPSNSTDDLIFHTGNPEVATVSDDGLLTAISKGTAEITIKCGEVTVLCQVTVGVVEPLPELVLNRQEITFTAEGETWMVYSGDIAVEEITWTSDDESVVLVSDGLIIAVGEGQTVVHAQYNDLTASCPVNCEFGSSDPGNSGGITEDGGGIGEDSGNMGGSGGGIGEDGGNGGVSVALEMHTTFGSLPYNEYLGAYDVTINAGQKLSFYLNDGTGNVTGVAWSLPAGTTCCRLGDVSNDTDNVLYALERGNVYLSGSYMGQTIKCYIRVN